jgi:hypothetical protein
MASTPDVRLTDIEITLEPGGTGKIPFQPLVQRLRVTLGQSALEKLAQQAVALAATKAPVEINLTGCRIVDGLVEISTRAGKGFLGADLTARLALSVVGGKEIRVALAGLDAPKWIPVSPMLDKAFAKAAAIEGVRIDPDQPQAVLVDPAAILVQNRLPARLAPGVWSTAVADSGVEIAFGGGVA